MFETMFPGSYLRDHGTRFMIEAHQEAELYYQLQLIHPHHNCHLCPSVTTMTFDLFA